MFFRFSSSAQRALPCTAMESARGGEYNALLLVKKFQEFLKGSIFQPRTPLLENAREYMVHHMTSNAGVDTVFIKIFTSEIDQFIYQIDDAEILPLALLLFPDALWPYIITSNMVSPVTQDICFILCPWLNPEDIGDHFLNYEAAWQIFNRANLIEFKSFLTILFLDLMFLKYNPEGSGKNAFDILLVHYEKLVNYAKDINGNKEFSIKLLIMHQ